MAEQMLDVPRILRMRAMLEALRTELRDLPADQGSLERLAWMHNTIETELGEAVPSELSSELAEFSSCCQDNPSPSKSEIRVAQAQLSGWLEGLLQGVQMSLAAQQAAQPGPPPQATPLPGPDDQSSSAYL